MKTTTNKVAVVGLGYVGLPLAVAFGGKIDVIGFDVNEKKVANILRGVDPTREMSNAELKTASGLSCTTNPEKLGEADIVIIAVPTPIDTAHQPDFLPLRSASETVGKHMKRGVTVVYESTVYPGATEEVCVPILERESGMKWRTDFHVGYSPERINPGDKSHRLETIVKIVAGDDAETTEKLARLYELVVRAGVHRASSIKVAEAAKVIENTQRDLNIALMNELAIIFNRLGLDTLEVLEAAGTKWNFLPFRPGLVGGHCIGVDPYYLTHKAEKIGYHSQVILAGRRINDGMGIYVAQQTVKHMIAQGRQISGAKVNLLGLTFKEDCPDVRNTRVVDLIHELHSYGIEVAVHDPAADAAEALHEYGIRLVSWQDLQPADALILAVAHKEFLALSGEALNSKMTKPACLVDVKSKLDLNALKKAGVAVWRL
jgi:UDP-N-acetyl-D-glucosamine/UDP-N-acetyl-D-galactosamine dehydrogenase